MSSQEALEQYFDILLDKDNRYSTQHPLVDDESRYIIYDEIREDFQDISENLAGICDYVQKPYPEYLATLKELSRSFKQLSTTHNDDFDFCVRAIAVERLIYSKESAGQLTTEMLGYLVEALIAFFFEEGDEVLRLSKQTLVLLKDKQADYSSQNDDELREVILDTLTLYEEVEEDLKQAKQGLIAKDKKMLQILRSMRMDLGKNLIQMGTKQIKLPKKTSLTQAVLKRSKRIGERGK